jgi:hypothetical protein
MTAPNLEIPKKPGRAVDRVFLIPVHKPASSGCALELGAQQPACAMIQEGDSSDDSTGLAARWGGHGSPRREEVCVIDFLGVLWILQLEPCRRNPVIVLAAKAPPRNDALGVAGTAPENIAAAIAAGGGGQAPQTGSPWQRAARLSWFPRCATLKDSESPSFPFRRPQTALHVDAHWSSKALSPTYMLAGAAAVLVVVAATTLVFRDRLAV